MKFGRPAVSPDRIGVSELGWLALIALLPLTPLLAPEGCFGRDWVSHLWLVSYYSEYFRQHWAFPEAIHTTQLAGLPIPVFYGPLLYPYLGVPGAWLGAAWAMRVATAAVFFLQSWQVFKLASQVGRDRTVALIVAAVTCWSTYALTNLYNRGAWAELIAVGLLTAAIGALGRAFILPPEERRAGDVASGLLWFVLAAGAHPITALCGGCFIAVLVTVFFLLAKRKGELVRWGALGSLVAILVLSPWAYAVAKFGSEVLVSKEGSKSISYLAVDSLRSRLMPFPYDSRVAEDPALPLEQVPYLDAQITAGLLLLALVVSAVIVLMHRRRVQLHAAGMWGVGVFWALFVFLFAVSVLPTLGAMLPFGRNIQYAYRLVTYLNLCLLVVVISGLAVLSRVDWQARAGKWRQAFLIGIVGVAALGLGIKLRHATDRAYFMEGMGGPAMVQMPRGFFGWRDYAIFVRRGIGDSPGTVINVPVGAETNFGRVSGFRIDLPVEGLVQIRVQPFPWNEVKLDGREVMAAPGAWHSEEGLFVPMIAGTHEIEYIWRPDLAWHWLNRISRTVLFLWIALVLALAVRKALGVGEKTIPTH